MSIAAETSIEPRLKIRAASKIVASARKVRKLFRATRADSCNAHFRVILVIRFSRRAGTGGGIIIARNDSRRSFVSRARARASFYRDKFARAGYGAKQFAFARCWISGTDILT